MMKRHLYSIAKIGLIGGLMLSLSACFITRAPIIPEGAAVLPIDSPITICVEMSAPCAFLNIAGDGYSTNSDVRGEVNGTARFTPLTQAASRQIYLLEAYDSANESYLILLARRAESPPPGAPSFDIAGIECADMTEAQATAFEAAGGEIETGSLVTTCITDDLDLLKSTLLDLYSKDLGSQDWWLENGPE